MNHRTALLFVALSLWQYSMGCNPLMADTISWQGKDICTTPLQITPPSIPQPQPSAAPQPAQTASTPAGTVVVTTTVTVSPAQPPTPSQPGPTRPATNPTTGPGATQSSSSTETQSAEGQPCSASSTAGNPPPNQNAPQSGPNTPAPNQGAAAPASSTASPTQSTAPPAQTGATTPNFPGTKVAHLDRIQFTDERPRIVPSLSIRDLNVTLTKQTSQDGKGNSISNVGVVVSFRSESTQDLGIQGATPVQILLRSGMKASAEINQSAILAIAPGVNWDVGCYASRQWFASNVLNNVNFDDINGISISPITAVDYTDPDYVCARLRPTNLTNRPTYHGRRPTNLRRAR
jgi:hypothetical protein